jgi:hypothetical protein
MKAKRLWLLIEPLYFIQFVSIFYCVKGLKARTHQFDFGNYSLFKVSTGFVRAAFAI